MTYALSRFYYSDTFDAAPFTPKKKLALILDAIVAVALFTFGLLALVRISFGVDLGPCNSFENLNAFAQFGIPIFIALLILGFDGISVYRSCKWNQIMQQPPQDAESEEDS